MATLINQNELIRKQNTEFILPLGKKVLTIGPLSIELKNSNDGRGHSFYRTNATRNNIARDLSILISRPDDTYEGPLNLVLTRILGKRQQLWDPDSVLRGTAKELIDSIVEMGFLLDDGPRQLGIVLGLQDASQREIGPAIQLDFYRPRA